MGIILGDLRYSLQVVEKNVTKDEFGAENVSWKDKIRLRAGRKFVGGEKSIDNKEIFNSKRVVFTTLYRAAITEDDRIIFKDEKYLIKSITEIGYREGLQIEAELIND